MTILGGVVVKPIGASSAGLQRSTRRWVGWAGMRRGLVLVLVAAVAVSIVTVGAQRALAVPSVTVDSSVDAFDGSCTDGDCSLRDAIAVVDDGGTVHVPPGFYPLTSSGAGPDAGDLDLVRAVTIVGDGETGSFLDASSLGDRVFDVAADVRLRHLTLLGGSAVGTGGIVRATGGSLRITTTTLSGGRARDGGAVAVGAGATATIGRSWIADSEATDRGGGLFVRGGTLVDRSTISGNGAAAGGGAFVAPASSLTLETTTVSGNHATRGGGVRSWGTLAVRSSTFGSNQADVGGGLFVSPAESVAESSIFARNRAESGPNCFGALDSGGRNVMDIQGCRLGAHDRVGVDVG